MLPWHPAAKSNSTAWAQLPPANNFPPSAGQTTEYAYSTGPQSPSTPAGGNGSGPEELPSSPIAAGVQANMNAGGGPISNGQNNAPLPQINNPNQGMPQPPIPPSSTAAPAMPANMSLSHILHFLQQEFRRFDRDRNEWEIERGELRARVALLEGERRGHENARNDLLRRVKMLEFALKGERSKYLSLSSAQTQLNQASVMTGKEALPTVKQSLLRNEENQGSDGRASPTPSNSNSGESAAPQVVVSAAGPPLSALPSHLQLHQVPREPAILSRPASALGIAPGHDRFATTAGQTLLEKDRGNGIGLTGIAGGWNPAIGRDPRGRARSRDYLKQCLQEISYLTANSTLNPLSEVSASGISRPRKVMVSLPTSQPASNAEAPIAAPVAGVLNVSTAPLLPASNILAPVPTNLRPIPGTDILASTAAHEPVAADYRPGSSLFGGSIDPVIQPTLEHDQFNEIQTAEASPAEPIVDELAGAGDLANAILPPLPADASGHPPQTPTSPMKELPLLEAIPGEFASEEDGDRPTAIFRPSSPTSWKAQLREAGQRQKQASLPLADDGELASLSLTESDEVKASTEGTAQIEKVWSSRRILRSHMDAVRCVAFGRSSDLMVASGSDDCTLKIWRLNPHTLGPLHTRMTSVPESEPQVTLRGHSDSITAMAIAPTQDRIYTASLDQTIRCWGLPHRDAETYAPFDSKLHLAVLEGHSDAIWDIAAVPLRIQDESLLVSASADGTVKVWNADGAASPLKLSWRYHGTSEAETDRQSNGAEPDPVPTALVVCHYDYRRIAVAYQNAVVKIFDIQNGVELLSLKSDESYDGTSATQINALATHPTLPILVTAHEDRYIRMFDLLTGECTHSILAHEDAVTAIDIDPAGLNLVSAGHDCSIRFWDLLSTRTCQQELAVHRQKAEEGVLSVRYHPSLPYVVSAGADGCCRIYSL